MYVCIVVASRDSKLIFVSPNIVDGELLRQHHYYYHHGCRRSRRRCCSRLFAEATHYYQLMLWLHLSNLCEIVVAATTVS